MRTLILNPQSCWIIRSTSSHGFIYFMSALTWGATPADATIFRSYEAAEDTMMRLRDAGASPMAIFDVVSLEAEVLALVRKGSHSPPQYKEKP